MKKFKLFFSDIQTQEKWINDIQEQGYRLVNVGPFLPIYSFEKFPDAPPVRLDFKDYMSKDKFNDYLTLFEDYGWTHLAGSRWGGFQYFQQTSSDNGDEIFSDQASKLTMSQTYYKAALITAFPCLVIVMGNILESNYWYLNPEIWTVSWQATVFALIPLTALFVLPPLFLLFMAVYYLIRACRIQVSQTKKRDSSSR